MSRLTITTRQSEETKALGERLAAMLVGGEVLCLYGELGAGKTCFVQGIARGLGICDYIISPTFIFVREYKGRLALFHVDAHRLKEISPSEADQQVGLSEYFERGGVVAIEWAEHVQQSLPAERMDIFFSHLSEGRKIEFLAWGERYKKLLGDCQRKTD